MIQTLFFALDPMLVIRKFLDFADRDPASRSAQEFVALEDWLNDGVPLAAPVAREALFGWYGQNTPARGAWTIAGRVVEPRAVQNPSLLMIPARDRIVPPGRREPWRTRCRMRFAPTSRLVISAWWRAAEHRRGHGTLCSTG